jgi:hypothetical protein
MDSGGGMQTDYELFLNALLHGDRRSAATVARKYAGSHDMIKFFTRMLLNHRFTVLVSFGNIIA